MLLQQEVLRSLVPPRDDSSYRRRMKSMFNQTRRCLHSQVSLLRGWMFKAMRGSFAWYQWFTSTTQEGKCLHVNVLRLSLRLPKNVANYPWRWFTRKTLQILTNSGFNSFSSQWILSYIKLNWVYRKIWVLTRIRTRELPLSCSGTPEGTRCLCRCFSFFFSNFFFPLRFCLFRVFFLGVSCVDELLSSWMDAVVGHATLLCSERGLKQKHGNSVNSTYGYANFTNTNMRSEMQTQCCQSNLIPDGETVGWGNIGTFRTGWTKLLGVLGFTCGEAQY